MMKHHIRVVEPEIADGSIEYKRQINGGNPTRLRSLGTQMMFRLDEGAGQCLYHVGVEDDGCHSLLDYPAVAESCRILEHLARSLNAIVVERTMIQKEVLCTTNNHQNYDTDHANYVAVADPAKRISFLEPAILGDAQGNVQEWPQSPTLAQYRQPGVLTRAVVRIQRIETHELDNHASTMLIMKEDSTKKRSLKQAAKEKLQQLRRLNAQQNGHTQHSHTPSMDSPISNGNSPINDRRIPPSSSPSPPTTTTTTSSKRAMTASSTSPPKPKTMSPRKKRGSNIGETLSNRNVRIAVMGNVDVGKSTLIGTLTTASLDDGRGKTRTFIMKHRHEIETGRTSTATHHLMGFNATGKPVQGRDSVRSKIKGMDEIAKESYKVVTLMDLAGHEKFLKTTIHGVASGFADYALVLVNSRQTPDRMTLHHLNLCCSFKIPIMVVFTKIDGCPDHTLATAQEAVTKMLVSPEIGKKPYNVNSMEDIAGAIDQLSQGTEESDTVPMFHISSVTGEGIELLQKLFFSLPKRRRHAQKNKRKFEFLVEDVFDVPAVGSVVAGFVNAGELSVGAKSVVYVGPMDDGSFAKSTATSAHIARINTTHITSGQSACLALSLDEDIQARLRPGMVVLQEGPTSTMQFNAEICVLQGENMTIREDHQAFVHILNVRQTAVARDIELVQHQAATDSDEEMTERDEDNKENVVLQAGSRAKVRFEFTQRPEYVRPGMRILFRDGRVRGVGLVTSVPTEASVQR